MQGNVVPRTASTGEASRSLPDIVTRPGSKSSNQRDRLIATLRYYHDKNRIKAARRAHLIHSDIKSFESMLALRLHFNLPHSHQDEAL